MRAVGTLAGVVLANLLSGLAPSLLPAAYGAVRVLDTKATDVDALRGVVVWQRSQGEKQILMRRVGGRVTRVPGVKPAFPSGGLDLGVDRRGRVVATYARCDELRRRCTGPYVVDVRTGEERRLALRARARCDKPVMASVWGSQIAYSLSCRRESRSGLYVARGRTSRRVIPSPAGEIDLGRDLVVAAGDEVVRIATVSGPPCRLDLPQTGNSEVMDLQVAADRVWWLRGVTGLYGGGESLLRAATVGPGCAATVDATVRKVSEITGGPQGEGFAIDGATLYVIRDFPAGAVAVPLDELPRE